MSTPFVRLLGAVRFVTGSGEVVDLPSVAQRRLLAALSLAAGTTQRSEYLGNTLELSTGSLRTTVSRLRSTIGDGFIETDTAGYRITCAIDTTMFTDLLVERPDHPDRLAALEEGLALWHGEALDEFRHEPWAAPEVARLDELRALAIEDRAELLIARSRAGEAVASLEAHVAANPLRDRPRGLLIQALATDGRQAEALRAYQAYRSFLADEVGTEPSALVRSIERRVAAGWVDHPADARTAPRPFVAPEGRPIIEVPLRGELTEAPALIGRQREMTWLESDLVAARSGSLRTALLGGESGIGKTTLLAAFARAQHQQGGNVVAYGRCVDGSAVPLEPFRGILTTLVEHVPLALLREHCERCGGELQRVVPRLTDRLWAPPPLASDDATERYQLFEAIADFFRRVASSGSLTLILDDLHWAEPTALLLLRHLSWALVDAPVLVVAGYRDTAPESTADFRSALADLHRGRCRWIPLAGFDDAELTRVIRSVTGVDEEPSADVLVQLHDETGGNPLYAVQLVRHFWESERLSVEGGQIRLASQDLGHAVPRSLLEVVWSRVRALGDPTADVLRSASVLGIDFAEDVLIDLTEASAPEVGSSLDAATGAGLLVDTGDVRRPLRFTHALVAHALYSDLPASHRRRLHGQAADVLLRRDRASSAETVVDLARHTALAGDLTAAQRWAVAAAAHASEHLAPAEAAAWYEQALAHATARQVADAEQAELMVRLGEAQRRAGDPATHRTLLAAAALAERAHAHDVLVRAALANDRGFTSAGTVDHEQLAALESAIAVADRDDTTSYARLLACRAQELVFTAQQELRLASAWEAIELIERSNDPTALPRMISGIVWGLWGPDPDTLALRRQLSARAVMMAGEAVDLSLEFSADRAAYYVAIESVDAGRARASLSRMKEIAAQLGEPRLRWLCTVFEVFEATMEARLSDAERLSGIVLELGTEIGEPNAFALYAAQLFVNRSCAGRYDEVIPLLEAAIADTPDAVPFKLAFAISCAAVGRRDEARTILQEGADSGIENLPLDFLWLTTVIGYAVLAIDLEDRAVAAKLYPIIEPFGAQVAFNGATSQGYIGAYLGRLASLLGHHDLADDHLRRALEVNVSFGWKYHQATTMVDLALSQRRRSGRLDAQGQAWLDDAEAIAADRGLANVIDHIAQIRR